MSKWETTTLEKISTDISYGYTASANLYKVGPHFLRITDIQGGVVNWATVPYCSIDNKDYQKNKLQRGDIVVARTGNTTGENYHFNCEQDCVFASYLIRFRVNETIAYPQFVWYQMRTHRWNNFITSAKTGSAQPGTNAKVLSRFPVYLPSLGEQKRIASILGSLDDKIELNRRMNETLEAMARAVFKSWFVDFDPVRAKAEGRQPSGMDAQTAALFPDSFQDSPLGKIPKGWEVATIGAHIEAFKGLSYKGSGLSDKGVPLHNLNSVYEGGCYKHEGLKHYIGEYRERHLCMPGDVIVTNTEQGFDYLLIGYPAIVPKCYGAIGIFTHHIYRVRPNMVSPLTNHFIYLMLLSVPFREQVIGYTNGTTVNALSAEGLQRPIFVLPVKDIIRRFEQTITPIFDKQETLHDETLTLTTLRDALLPKLISGEIDLHMFHKGNI